MKIFMDDELFLDNEISIEIYNQYAKSLPIYDYHCHLSPREIAEDKVFYDIGELMLAHDHYKWRLMRACGIDEKYITGKASFKEKFIAYGKALAYAIGNPVYHWTHMELKRYFGINEALSEYNAERIYDEANKMMADGSFSARKLIKESNVYLIGTTDDPTDNLEYHKLIMKDKAFKTKVVPTFRPEFLCSVSNEDYVGYIKKLGDLENRNISHLDALLDVLVKRMDYFEEMGCKISDISIFDVPDCECTYGEADDIFTRVLSKEIVTEHDAEKFLAYMLVFLAGEYKKRNWVMQIHLNVVRNQNSRLYDSLGADCGIDSVGDVSSSVTLGKFFDRIENLYGIPKTIIYTLNPSSYQMLATMLGNFQGGVPGKVQLGAAWWFNDHKEGIRQQLKISAHTGVLGLFNGMTTDSRSLTSYIRHDYFRRILCSLIGEWISKGEYPYEGDLVKNLIQNICFYNAKNYFNM